MFVITYKGIFYKEFHRKLKTGRRGGEKYPLPIECNPIAYYVRDSHGGDNMKEIIVPYSHRSDKH